MGKITKEFELNNVTVTLTKVQLEDMLKDFDKTEEPEEPKFKVGDFVRCEVILKGSTKQKVIARVIKGNKLKYYSVPKNWSSRPSVANGSPLVKHWKPEIGELVVHNITKYAFSVGVYGGEKTSGHLVAGSSYCVHHIEPFIGEAPTI